MKRMRVFAGPSGSGKSTMVQVLIEKGYEIYKQNLINPNRHISPDEINSNDVLDFSKYGLIIDENDFRDYMFHSPFFKYCNINIEDFKINNNCFTIPKRNQYIGSMLVDYLCNCYIKSEEPLFSYETVLSHPSRIDFLKKAKDCGWWIYLYFISTSDPYINCDRIEDRVLKGKHNVPRDKIKDRYTRSHDNLFAALQHCRKAYIFDNSAEMQLIAKMHPNGEIELCGNSPPLWFIYLISKKAKIACKESIGTTTEEIACAVSRQIQKWEIGNQEEMKRYVENLIFALKSKIPNIPTNKEILAKIEALKNEKNITKQYEILPTIISLIPQIITVDVEKNTFDIKIDSNNQKNPFIKKILNSLAFSITASGALAALSYPICGIFNLEYQNYFNIGVFTVILLSSFLIWFVIIEK